MKTKSTKILKPVGKIDAAFIRNGAKNIKKEDIQRVIDQTEIIRKRFNPKGPLSRFVEDSRLLLSIVKDYWTGKYRHLPYLVISAIVFSLLYVLNPLDLFPDFIPLVGQIDDASIIIICLLLVEQELHSYRTWKMGKGTKEILPGK